MTGLKTFYISHSIRKVEYTFLKLKVILKNQKPKYCFYFKLYQNFTKKFLA